MKTLIMSLEATLKALEMTAVGLDKDAATHKKGSEIRTRWEQRAVGIRQAAAAIREDIQKATVEVTSEDA